MRIVHNKNLFLLLFGGFCGALLSMDYETISFDLLPPEAQESVFEHAMIADPYNAWRLACVCKVWNNHINDLQVTTHVVNTDAHKYAHSYWVKPNPKTCLQTAGLARYTNISATFAKLMEYEEVREEDLNCLFCSQEKPYRYIICNNNDRFPMMCACSSANLVGITFLHKYGVTPTQDNFISTLDWIKKQSNHKKAAPYVQCFKLLCEQNLPISRSSDLLLMVRNNFHTTTERFYALLKILTAVGTDLNSRDEDDDTVLSYAHATYSSLENKKEAYTKVVILCLQHGANPHIKPKNDACVYELARQDEDQSFFELIKTHYKPIEKKD